MSRQESLFETPQRPPVALTPLVSALLAAGAPVSIGVSGGKDSTAVAFATSAYLDEIGHAAPRLLVHSDLGRVEWEDSLPTCERLASALGLELLTVRREAGDLMDRWLTRWENNCRRYADLSCVKLILPWSTAAMRFCTSEMKTAIICRALVKRFPGETILSVSGIRRQESAARAHAPIYKEQPKLTSKAHRTSGYDWHPIIDWSLSDVLAEAAAYNFPSHEAYRTYGSSRVSCAFCILGSRADLAASAACPGNEAIYREMVALEVRSTFAFQDSGWLGDIAPHLLDGDTRAGMREAKERACIRQEAEAHIPAHLLYTRGWPTVMPTLEEAEGLAAIRQTVAGAVGLQIGYTTAGDILGRYAALMAARPDQRELAADGTVQPRLMMAAGLGLEEVG